MYDRGVARRRGFVRRKTRIRRVRPGDLRCPRIMRDGKQCWRWRGEGTPHDGVGYCDWHDLSLYGSGKLWEDLVNVARELEITPWEALLQSVRLAAGRVKWVDEQLADAVRRNDGDVDTAEVRRWLGESRKERMLMARVSKAAIDSGIAERVVRQVEVEGRAVAAAVAAALDRLNLPHEQRVVALEAAHARLMIGPDGEGDADAPRTHDG
jgi:hypothetical protein